MGILEKFVERMARGKGGLACPKCGMRQTVARTSEVATCGTCGYRASVTEWSMRGFGADHEDRAADPDTPPPGTRIVRKEIGSDTIAWEVPPSGKSGGLLAFGILWTGFVCFWTVGALIATGKSDESEAMFFPLFSLPFWAVGIGMLYFGLRAKYAWHLLMLSPKTIVLARSFFKRNTRKSLARKNLESVEKKEFYKQNYSPVYGIEIRGPDGKIRFGTTLGEDEKDWLVADMKRLIWPETSGKTGPTRHPTDPGERPPQPPRKSEVFEVTFPPARANGSIAGMIVGFIVVGAFLAVGIWVIKDAGFFRWIWLGLNCLFAIGMIAGAVTSWRNRNRFVRVRGDRSGVHVEELRGRIPVKEICIPRGDRIEVRSFNTGRVNNSAMVRIELIGNDKVIPLVKWYPEEAAREPIAELRAWLA